MARLSDNDTITFGITWIAAIVTFILWALFSSGCGIEGPTNVPPECDTYNYFIDFQKHDRASVVELTCHNANNFAVWTIYTDTAGSTVYYLANSKPVRIESTVAPTCITDKYTELVPDPAVFAMKDCSLRDIVTSSNTNPVPPNGCNIGDVEQFLQVDHNAFEQTFTCLQPYRFQYEVIQRNGVFVYYVLNRAVRVEGSVAGNCLMMYPVVPNADINVSSCTAGALVPIPYF